MKIVVLASGRGSNFEAIATAVRSGLVPNTTIVGLVCNNPEAPVLQIARAQAVPTFVHASKPFYQDKRLDRDAYETRLLEILAPLGTDYLCLAGYTLLLGPKLVQTFQNRILNIHPSLLPAFKGLRAQKQALEAGVKRTGCTVHVVTEALDDGPILLQQSVEVLEDDTEESLSARLRPVEHRVYVEVLKGLATGLLSVKPVS